VTAWACARTVRYTLLMATVLRGTAKRYSRLQNLGPRAQVHCTTWYSLPYGTYPMVPVGAVLYRGVPLGWYAVQFANSVKRNVMVGPLFVEPSASALTIALLLWPCTTLPASAAWRICGGRHNAFCVVEEKSSRPCGLGLTERGGQTWPDKWGACRAILNGIRHDLKVQCINRPVPGCS